MKRISSLTLNARSLWMVATCALIIGGCTGNNNGNEGGGTKASGPPVQGDWVVVHDLADPETLNILTAQDASAQEIHQPYLYESLTTVMPNLERIPLLADSLAKISADHLSYEYTIKKQAKFSDGHPVTGEDIIFYVKAIKNPHVIEAAPLRGYLARIKSVELVNNDPYHIKITMIEPYYLGGDVTGDLIAIPKHILDPENLSDKFTFDELNAGDANHNPAMQTLGDKLRDPSRSFSKQFIVGSGPYMFDEFRRNDRVVLVRNPNYWDKNGPYGKAYPDKIIWRSVNDYNAALTSLKGGEIDVMPRLEKVQYNNEKDRFPANHLKPAIYDYPAFNFIGYNIKRPIFQDKLVRLALSHAVNRDLIVQKIYYGMARPVQSPIFYRAKECDTTLPLIKYDLEQAKSLLAQAGWKDSDGDGILDKTIDGKKVDFRFTIQLNSGNQSRKQIALIFVDALKKLGIDAKTTELEWATYFQRQRAHDFDAYVGGWATSVTEGDLYQIWHSKSAEEGGSNFGSYKNERLDQLIESNRTEFDWSKRLANYKEMQKIIYDDQPYTFLVSERWTGAYNDRFQDVTFFAPRPCYYAGWWWVPLTAQKYKGGKSVAMN